MKEQKNVHRNRRVFSATAAIVALLLVMLVAVTAVSGAGLAPSGESTLGDFVWHDVNYDGEQAGEGALGINGVAITLYLDDGDGVFEPGTDDPIYVEPPEDGVTTTANHPTSGDPGWYDYEITADGNKFWVVIDDSNFDPGGALEDYVLTSTDVTSNYSILGTPGNGLRMYVSAPDMIMDLNEVDWGFAQAGIQIVKTAGNAADGAVEYLGGPPSVSVIYYLVVTNTGDTPLASVQVTDPTCSGTVTFTGGDTNGNNRLEKTETWNYTCTHSEGDNGLTTNIATVTGNPVDDQGDDLPSAQDVSDTDDADIFVVNPGIQVVKTAGNAADGAVEYIPSPGGNVTYTYVVTNTGDTHLSNIVVVDDNGTPGNTADDMTVCTITGPLAPGASTSCTHNKNVTADETNIATATGNPTDDQGVDLPDIPDVTDTDDAVVDMVAPGIQVVKTAGNAADGTVEYIPSPGGNVDYTYVVTNTGDTHLSNIVVVDDNGTPGNTADDVTVCTIAGPLAPGASTTCTHSKNVTADETNIATVTGNPTDDQGVDLPDIPDVTDTDDAEVNMVAPGIQIVKTAGNAVDGAVEYIPSPGGNVIYTYVVTNTGDTHLSNIVVVDDNGTLGNTTDDVTVCTIMWTLAPGASTSCTYSKNVTADVTNIATVTGNPTDSQGVDLPDIPDVTDTDDAVVDMVAPGIQVVKTAGNAADGAVEYIPSPGGNVTYTYVVTNTGDTHLSNIVVVDDNGTPGNTADDVTVCTIAGPLAPGASTTCTHSKNVTADETNIATVTGNPTDDQGVDLPDIPDVTDTDDAVVDMVAPGIQIVKTAGSAVDGDTLYLVTPGGNVTYTYVVTNTGDTHLSNIVVVDDNGTPGNTADDVTVCTIAGPLAAGASTTCTHNKNVTADETNIATVTGNPTDSQGVDLPDIPDVSDTDDAVVDIVRPALTVTKELLSPEPVRPNDEVHFTITIENTGDIWIHELPLVDEYDTEYLSYGHGGQYATTADSDNHTNDGSLEWSDLTQSGAHGFSIDLEPGQSFTLHVYFTAVKDTGSIVGPPAGETVNTAIVDGALADPDGAGGPAPPDIPVPRDEDTDDVEIFQPTGLGLINFDASNESGDVLLAWETANELDLVGFKLLRRRGQDDYREITGFISADYAGAGSGAAYDYVDASLTPGDYTYALLAVKSDGSMRLLATDSVMLRWLDPFVAPTDLLVPVIPLPN